MWSTSNNYIVCLIKLNIAEDVCRNLTLETDQKSKYFRIHKKTPGKHSRKGYNEESFRREIIFFVWIEKQRNLVENIGLPLFLFLWLFLTYFHVKLCHALNDWLWSRDADAARLLDEIPLLRLDWRTRIIKLQNYIYNNSHTHIYVYKPSLNRVNLQQSKFNLYCFIPKSLFKNYRIRAEFEDPPSLSQKQMFSNDATLK